MARFALFAALAAGASLCNTVDGQSPQQQAPAGLTQYTIGTPSGDETEILEIINRARANPAAEGQRLVDMLNTNFPGGTSGIDLNQLLSDFQGYPARPPLAFNADLNAAAQFHLPEMIAFGNWTHYSPNGEYFDVRIESFGYQQPFGENVAASPDRPVEADLTEDNYETDTNEPGYVHRLNVMEPDSLRATEIGIAQKALGGWNVEDFGAGRTPTLLTGAVFADNAATGFYVSGEGVASVTVTAPGASSFYAVTGEGGAYTLPLDLLTFAPLLSGSRWRKPSVRPPEQARNNPPLKTTWLSDPRTSDQAPGRGTVRRCLARTAGHRGHAPPRPASAMTKIIRPARGAGGWAVVVARR